jgi:hypothetical protein
VIDGWLSVIMPPLADFPKVLSAFITQCTRESIHVRCPRRLNAFLTPRFCCTRPVASPNVSLATHSLLMNQAVLANRRAWQNVG